MPPDILKRSNKYGTREYRRGQMLGKGGFARCFQITDVSDPSKVYAAKAIQKDTLTEKTEAKLLSEIKIHRSLRHDGIVRLYTQFEDDEFVYIILELCTNQTLLEMLRARKRITETEIRYYLLQIILTLRYIHSQRVIHRDLKLGNLFIHENMTIKLGDFGLATKLESDEERRKTVCGTPNYIAPEIITKNGVGHTFPVDVWSLGCIVYTMIVGKPPFQSTRVHDTYSKIRNSLYSWPSSVTPSKNVQDLVKRMLHVDPMSRPSLGEILLHPFFSEPIPAMLPRAALRTALPMSDLPLKRIHEITFYGESGRPALASRDDGGAAGHPSNNTVTAMETEPVPASGNRSAEPRPLARPVHHASAPPRSRNVPSSGNAPARATPLAPHASGSHGSGAASQQRPTGARPESKPQEGLLCMLTGGLMKEPVQATCGHWFDAGSLVEYIQAQEWLARGSGSARLRPACPACRYPINSPVELHQMPEARTEIQRFVNEDTVAAQLLRNKSFTSACLAHYQVEPHTATTRPPCGNRCVSRFIMSHLDYSSKYGLTYKTYAGQVGALFNDCSHICLTSNQAHIKYIPYSPNGDVDVTPKYMTPGAYPKSEEKKVKLIMYFSNYFDEKNAENVSENAARTPDDPNFPLVVSWTRSENDEFLFHFADGGVQISFRDGSKIMYYQKNHCFTFMSPSGAIMTYPFASAVYNVNNSIAKRVQILRSLLFEKES